ncbi:MAG: aminopeptidase [Parvibaculaceae bacterium]
MTHDILLDRYAQLIIRSGLNLQKGQQLLITSPIDAVPLVRRITEHAYKAGAPLVTTLYSDDPSTLARYQFAGEDTFDEAPAWLFDGMAAAFKAGAARLGIIGDDPALLGGQDPKRVARTSKARSRAYQPVLELIAGFAINWNLSAYATPAWAKSVFPGLPEKEAVQKLWAAIFACCRADLDDPIAAWEEHSRNLAKRTAMLNGKAYSALRYKGPGTDLTLGLADQHVWKGGAAKARNGVVCNPNIPTEEVYSMPHKNRVDGTLSSTKPLSYNGTMIEGIVAVFEKGRIVKVDASKGADAFRALIATDEGAARLGEVALVPHSSPISQSGIIFNNTLFDENAACHIAVGQCYADTTRDGGSLSKEDLAKRGGNQSLVHVDWMVGSGALDIDGVKADGTAEPLMRKGEWAA